jgi:electron transport complex protein RnfG
MSQMLKLVLVLFTACFLAAGSLAGVNEITKKSISDSAEAEKVLAMQAVQPDATAFKETIPGRAWDAVRGEELIGRVINTEIQGYAGPVKLLYGLDREDKITEVKILFQTETPGLGARVTDPAFLAQFQGQDVRTLALKKAGSGGSGRALAGTLYVFPPAGEKNNEPGIDAITGATISSRAVTHGIKEGRNVLDQTAGEETK